MNINNGKLVSLSFASHREDQARGRDVVPASRRLLRLRANEVGRDANVDVQVVLGPARDWPLVVERDSDGVSALGGRCAEAVVHYDEGLEWSNTRIIFTKRH